MAVTTCLIDGIDCRLEYQKDFSDNTYSGILHLKPPVLFSFSDSLFIPPIKESHQLVIRNTIKVHEELEENNPAP